MKKRRILLTEFAIQVYSDRASRKCRKGSADGRIVWNGFDKFLWSHLRQPAAFFAKRYAKKEVPRQLRLRQRSSQ